MRDKLLKDAHVGKTVRRHIHDVAGGGVVTEN